MLKFLKNYLMFMGGLVLILLGFAAIGGVMYLLLQVHLAVALVALFLLGTAPWVWLMGKD